MSKNALLVNARWTSDASLGETPGVQTGAIGAFGSCVSVAVSTPIPARERAHAVIRSAPIPVVDELALPPSIANASCELIELTKNALHEASQLRGMS